MEMIIVSQTIFNFFIDKFKFVKFTSLKNLNNTDENGN